MRPSPFTSTFCGGKVCLAARPMPVSLDTKPRKITMSSESPYLCVRWTGMPPAAGSGVVRTNWVGSQPDTFRDGVCAGWSAG